MMSGEGKVVCVTGASGFIASWLVKVLLRRGYTVHATVRNLKDPTKVTHLLTLDGAKERLHLFEADLLKEKSFDLAIDGCEGIFHIASPITFSPSATKAELLDPAIKGTLNVLGSCARTPFIKRVILTSSTASVMFKRNSINSTDIINETWFSDKEFAEESKLWYILSKILAEEAAKKYAEENGIDLVSLHPSLVIGPILGPTLNFSNGVLLDLIMEGKEFMSREVYCYVDVRDVVNGHIQAFETPSASGRYLLNGVTARSSKVLKIVHKLYPSLSIPEKFKGDWSNLPTFQVSQEKAKSLDINFTSFEVSLKDTIESLKERNLLNL